MLLAIVTLRLPLNLVVGNARANVVGNRFSAIGQRRNNMARRRSSSIDVLKPKTQHLYIWQISLQVTSSDRPLFKHQIQYRVQALSSEKIAAIAKAVQLAARDGYTVVGTVGAARGYKVS